MLVQLPIKQKSREVKSLLFFIFFSIKCKLKYAN